jgi:hypothetical protein
VLLIRFWHPDLTEVEVQAFTYVVYHLLYLEYSWPTKDFISPFQLALAIRFLSPPSNCLLSLSMISNFKISSLFCYLFITSCNHFIYCFVYLFIYEVI